ncbi:MAG: NH(3)-dependent NAD(+) synthetase [Candidatus Hepatoplasma vulgare]|nr:MAG: NH(3)-dependent NAD(+) synthetase [Candidatus Hepatoplasma sp.]
MNNEINKIIVWIKEEVKKANAKGVIVATSGGIDSTVLLSLAKKAFPNNTFALWIDIYSSLNFKKLAREQIKKNNVNFKEINLGKFFDNFLKEIKIDELDNTSKANLKARIRMITIYTYASKLNYLVLGSTNAIEYYLGYFTKWGDGCADLYPLLKYKKSEVRELAKELNIEEKIINLSPSADLYPNQTDEKELGFSYKEVEDFLSGKEIEEKIEEKIIKMHKNTEHKRKNLINYFK